MEREKQGSSFDFFVKSKNGYEAALHVDIADLDMTPAQDGAVRTRLDVLLLALNRVDKLLDQAGFVRSERLDKPARGGGGRPPQPSKPIELEDGEVVRCKFCDSDDLYDNRERKQKEGWRGPNFKCKKCRAVCWDVTGDEWKPDRAA